MHVQHILVVRVLRFVVDHLVLVARCRSHAGGVCCANRVSTLARNPAGFACTTAVHTAAVPGAAGSASVRECVRVCVWVACASAVRWGHNRTSAHAHCSRTKCVIDFGALCYRFSGGVWVLQFGFFGENTRNHFQLSENTRSNAYNRRHAHNADNMMMMMVLECRVYVCVCVFTHSQSLSYRRAVLLHTCGRRHKHD